MAKDNKMRASIQLSPADYAAIALQADSKRLSFSAYVVMVVMDHIARDPDRVKIIAPKPTDNVSADGRYAIPGTNDFPPAHHCKNCSDTPFRGNCDRERSCHLARDHAYIRSQRQA
jgi:hypothetical protein